MIPSGQKFVRTQELEINRLDPTKTDGSRENVDITGLVSAMNVTSVAVDPTAGTVAGAFSLPETALIIGVTLDVLSNFTSGTTVEVGNADPDSLLSVTTPTVGAVAGSGAEVGAIGGGTYNITVTGTYDGGSGTLKVIWFEAKATA